MMATSSNKRIQAVTQQDKLQRPRELDVKGLRQLRSTYDAWH